MLALAIAYPLLVHAGILWPSPWLQWLALTVLCALPLHHALREGRWWAWTALVLAALAAGASVQWGAAQFLLFLPPILIPLSLLGAFGATLRADREPLITRIARVSRGGILPPELVPYTRRLTLVWCGAFVAMAVSAVVLCLFAPLEAWSVGTNFAPYALIGALFVGDHTYRRLRFRHLPHPGFLSYLRLIGPSMR
jgi:uncharacterized membrane protein